MTTVPAVILSLTLLSSVCDGVKTFPPGFKFGAATSSYQVEGAWDSDGKGESIWDRFVHKFPEAIFDNSTGDVAAESYKKWKEDIRIASDLGLQFYRFSISWPRIFPTGFTNKPNEAGIKYYSDLIDALLDVGIEPIITLYHWELPVVIQDLGGWANPYISDWFADYAIQVFSLYADRVKTWLTINEPWLICDVGYVDGTFAPGIKEDQLGPYICTKNLLMAHAKAYRVFDRIFRSLYGGRISIANHLLWFEAESPENENLAQLTMEFMVGRYCHPIFSKRGGWPPNVEKLMKDHSEKKGYSRSRLPAFTAAERRFVRGTADFFGMNYYLGLSVRQAKTGEKIVNPIMSGSNELNAVMGVPPDAYISATRVVYPVGLRRSLSWVKKSYGNWEIFITENGYPTAGLELEDYDRVVGLKKHLEQIHLSIYEDGVNVVGYTNWALMDNFEWINGYSVRFGLYQIDFNDPERKREPKLSSKYYKCVIENNSFDVPKECFDMSFNQTEVRSKRQINLPKIPFLPKPSEVADGVDFMKEVYDNRRCIAKVMCLFGKMVSLMGNN
ncbi:unnamed protein product [Pieris brassicae]|uniref:Myrosinase 1-like n=1 Tax=Pieris brassicae TaxID=7116 RepID=A0A9P0T6P9_PIEBR|nr:unnamed protein product [Pieris brassicae]